MIDSFYKNRMWYYNIIKDYLECKIKAYPLCYKYMGQRDDDLNENRNSGFNDYDESQYWDENQKKFYSYYFNKLYNRPDNLDLYEHLKEYVEGAKKYNISGELFLSGINQELFKYLRDFDARNIEEAKLAGWDEVSDEGIESFIDYTPEEYEKDYSIDETELRKRLKTIFEILNDNKERWM